MTTNLARLSTIGNITPADYQHYPKLITPADDLALPDAHLKWYDVRRPEASMDSGLREQAREFVLAEAQAGRLQISGELGFVIHHLCGESFYFLIVCTWRHANEMWETLYGRDLADGGPFCLIPRGTHLEVVCVWELGAVLHEQQAWIRYLYSDRDERAKLAYIEDRFSGTV
jgi:hypothetical protein